MNVELKSAFLSGNIKAIPSKSYAHRIAICNFLAGENPVSNCGEFRSNDIVVTEKCLSDLRAGQTVLDCGESGSTLRFLIPLCATIGGEFEFICHGKLIERPNVELFSAIEKNGVTAIQTDKIYLKGKLEAGKFFVKGNVSSQYVSGLLMALPFLKEDSEIVLTTPLSSAPYVDITIQVLNAFGVDVQKTANGFFVKGGQRYCGNIKPEGDWSNSAFFLCAGAINGDVAVSGLNLDSVQGDKQILQVLESAGATVIKNQVGVQVKKSNLKSFIMDAENCPDLVPICACLASFANGVSVIKNVTRLKIKESDRIESVISMLSAFSVKAEFNGVDLIVHGGSVQAGKVNSFNDHRIVMSSAVMALGANGSSVITGAQAVNKSYPNFFNHYNLIGGRANEF